jgi:hypothetical protein
MQPTTANTLSGWHSVRERNLRDGDAVPTREHVCACQPLDVLFGAEIRCTPMAHGVVVWILRIVVT